MRSFVDFFFTPLLHAAMIVYHSLLPNSYLLALAPAAATPTATTELAAHLARACRSGKPAVWIDCRLLDTFSATAAGLLWACQRRLHRRHARLVLCRVSAAAESVLRHTLAGMAGMAGIGAGLLIVPTLDDAAALT